ncbi:MAG: flagellar hook-length control protein FliK [Pseudomonadota bacterium]
MPDLTISALPAPISASGQSNAAANTAGNSSDNASDFQAILSGKMAPAEKPVGPQTGAKSSNSTGASTTTAKDAESKPTDVSTQSTDNNAAAVAAAAAALVPPIAILPINVVTPPPVAVTPASDTLSAQGNINAVATTKVDGAATKSVAVDKLSTEIQTQLQANGQIRTKAEETAIETAFAAALDSKQSQIQNAQNETMRLVTMTTPEPLTSPSAPVQTATPTFSIRNTVGSSAWTNELGNRMTYMVGEKMQSAEIHLNPENLGPVDVHIKIDADKQTSITFTALNPDTRNALENAMPQLRNMLTESGISVSNFSVSADAFAGASQQGMGGQRQQGGNTSTGENVEPVTTVTRTLGPNGLVDTFA